jgi:hypothetical protein
MFARSKCTHRGGLGYEIDQSLRSIELLIPCNKKVGLGLHPEADLPREACPQRHPTPQIYPPLSGGSSLRLCSFMDSPAGVQL